MLGVNQIRLVVVQVVAVGDQSELFEIRRCVNGTADRRREPGLGRPADDFLVSVESASNHRALFLGLVGVKGEQVVLRPVVRHQLPTALIARVDDAAALGHRHAVDRARGLDADAIEHLDHAPYADALAIFAPRPVRGVESVAGEGVRNRHRSAGEQRLFLSGAKGLPVFDIDGENQRQPRSIGKTQRHSVGERNVRIG